MAKTRSIRTLVRYLLKHEVVFFSCSPRISWAEWRALDEAGYRMQSEHGLHENPIAYPLRWDEFRKKAAEEFGL